jgi:hypothetical protein
LTIKRLASNDGGLPGVEPGQPFRLHNCEVLSNYSQIPYQRIICVLEYCCTSVLDQRLLSLVNIFSGNVELHLRAPLGASTERRVCFATQSTQSYAASGESCLGITTALSVPQAVDLYTFWSSSLVSSTYTYPACTRPTAATVRMEQCMGGEWSAHA